MSDHRPARVRVTGPPRRVHAPLARTGDIDAQTPLGGVYLGSLLLLFHLFPDLAEVDVAGLPLAWLLLGVLVYPWLIFLGLWFVRRVERNERDFAVLLHVREDQE